LDRLSWTAGVGRLELDRGGVDVKLSATPPHCLREYIDAFVCAYAPRCRVKELRLCADRVGTDGGSGTA